MSSERFSFVSVHVEEHEALPDGCSLRFRAQGEGRPIERVTYESESGTAGVWTVAGEDADGGKLAATAFDVDDSSAGTSLLVIGGAHGLRLTSVETGETIAESYLLLSLGSATASG